MFHVYLAHGEDNRGKMPQEVRAQSRSFAAVTASYPTIML